MEVLAPAGGMESLLAAVRCGADAVYLGLGAFNARRGAQNFDGAALFEAARCCNRHGVKLYLALNTLFFDSEASAVVSCIQAACEVGVAAVIVQDAGVLRLLRLCAPGLPVFASTQMSVHNLAGVKQLARAGFSRVVLARELSLREIRAICRESPIEVEVFCHGALCMCLSGQCTFSSVLGARSGNRGMCAQPCRLPFRPGENGHALSLRDLSLLSPGSMRALEGAGVTSVKIEGRMKRPEYVAAAVTAARQALDGVMPDTKALRDAFSRSGFTDGYFTGHIGKKMFGTRTKEDVQAAPGGYAALQRLYQKEVGRIPVDFSLSLERGRPAKLSAVDCAGNTSDQRGPVPQQAASRPLGCDEARQYLSKLGGTCFVLGKTDVKIDGGITLPAKDINALRRAAVEELDRQRSALRPVAFTAPPPPPAGRSAACGEPRFRVALTRAEQFSPELAESCELTALYPGELARLLSRPGAGGYLGRLAVRQPPVSFDESILERELLDAWGHGIRHLVVSGLSGILLGAQIGFTLHGDFSLNVANTWALEEYSSAGLADCTVSVELAAVRIGHLGGALPRGIVGHGRLPLMTMRCCPLREAMGCARCRGGEGYLTDRRGERFPVSCLSGAPQLYNSHTLYTADRLAEFHGIDFVWLLSDNRGSGETLDLIRRYQEGLEPESPSGFTRGLYFRKVH